MFIRFEILPPLQKKLDAGRRDPKNLHPLINAIAY